MTAGSFFSSLILRGVYLFHMGDFALSGRIHKPEQRPENIWPGEPLRGKQIFNGRFELAGGDITFPGKIGWHSDKAGREWHEALHSFVWIRDVVAFSNTKLAARHVRDCIHHWIDNIRDIPPLARQPEITGERISNWIAHTRFILAGADLAFRREWLRSIASQGLFLHRQLLRKNPHAAFASVKGLIYIGLSLPHTRFLLKAGVRHLNRLLQQTIGEDGLHHSRSPSVQHAVLRCLIEIRTALQRRRGVQLNALEEKIHAMSAALRTLMHGDGKLALFNDSIEESAELLRQTFAHAGGYMPASSHIQSSGFCRLARGNLLIILDGGLPGAEPRHRHFGSSSMEVSAGNERIFVNCGAWRGTGDTWRRACRATAAHSTLCIDEINAWDDAPALPAPEIKREEQEGALHLTVTSHGYAAQTGLIHRRRITMAAGGMSLSGIDSLSTASGKHDDNTRQVAVRFHLHPDIKAMRSDNGDITLLCPSGALWKFTSSLQFVCALEESVYLGESAKPKKTSQIVIDTPLLNSDFTLEWSLIRAARE